MWKSTSASGALSHFSAMTRPSWLGRAARNRHRHAIEQASRRWRGGRCDDSGRTRRELLIYAQVTETWTGQYDSAENKVEGVVLEGASEPEYAGRFSLTPAFPSLQPVVKNNILRKNETQWRVSDVAGEYTLEFQGDGSISAYDIKLLPNRTWTSVGLSATLAGSWNVFDSDVNLASGIDGTGPRLWLWLRRCGQTSSSGVHLSQDRLYLGRITGAAGDASKIRRVKGQVAVGWSTEPAFIGSFRLVPRHSD